MTGIFPGGTPITGAHANATVNEIYVGADKVWPTREYVIEYPDFTLYSQAQREAIGNAETNGYQGGNLNFGVSVLVDPVAPNVGRWSNLGLPATLEVGMGWPLTVVSGKTYNYRVLVSDIAFAAGLAGRRSARFAIGREYNAGTYFTANTPDNGGEPYEYTGQFTATSTDLLVYLTSRNIGGIPSDPRAMAFEAIEVWSEG